MQTLPLLPWLQDAVSEPARRSQAALCTRRRHFYCANYLDLRVCGPVAHPHQQRHRCTEQMRPGGSEKSSVLPKDTQLVSEEGWTSNPSLFYYRKQKNNKHSAHFSSAYFMPGPVPGFTCTVWFAHTRVEAGQEMTERRRHSGLTVYPSNPWRLDETITIHAPWQSRLALTEGLLCMRLPSP